MEISVTLRDKAPESIDLEGPVQEHWDDMAGIVSFQGRDRTVIFDRKEIVRVELKPNPLERRAASIEQRIEDQFGKLAVELREHIDRVLSRGAEIRTITPFEACAERVCAEERRPRGRRFRISFRGRI